MLFSLRICCHVRCIKSVGQQFEPCIEHVYYPIAEQVYGQAKSEHLFDFSGWVGYSF